MWPSDWGAVAILARYREFALVRPEACPADRLLLVGDAELLPRLQRIAEEHRRIQSDTVPSPGACRIEGPCSVLELESSGIATLADVVPVADRRETKLAYAGAIAFNELMMDCVEAAHSTQPATFLAALSWRNVLLSARGGVQVFGFGAAFPRSAHDGPVMAPEVMLGAEPSASADVFVLHGTLRGLLPYVELHGFFETALRSQAASPIRRVLAELSAAATSPESALRPPSVEALRERYRAVRQLVPELPQANLAELEEYFAKLLRSDFELTVQATERWVSVDRQRIELSSRPVLWRVLSALLSAHRALPGAAVSLEDLVTAGWPEERIRVDSARARVYVALSSLRKAGLEGYIERVDGGWRLLKQLAVTDTDDTIE